MIQLVRFYYKKYKSDQKSIKNKNISMPWSVACHYLKMYWDLGR